jgi:hypothetical protein
VSLPLSEHWEIEIDHLRRPVAVVSDDAVSPPPDTARVLALAAGRYRFALTLGRWERTASGWRARVTSCLTARR